MLHSSALTCARGTPQKHPARGVYADLLIQLMLRERQLHSLPDLLLLDVVASNVLQMFSQVETHPGIL